MRLKSIRHDRALRLEQGKIFESKLAGYIKEVYLYGSTARGQERWNSDIDLLLVLDPQVERTRELKREILYLKGSITGDELDDPEVDLKVVFGDEWKSSSQTFYRNVLQEGQRIWIKN